MKEAAYESLQANGFSDSTDARPALAAGIGGGGARVHHGGWLRTPRNPGGQRGYGGGTHVPKSGDTINPQFGDQISPSLTNGDTVVQGDISSLRVLLLLADADGNKYLQAAVWDADSATYAITRSSNLPENAYLDTYHEGDAIFLSVGYDTPGFAESGDLDDLAWLYITAEWTDTDAWVVTDVTDGFSFFVDYDDGQYVIRDYWDEDVLQTISRDATLDTFDFVNPFAAEIGWMK